MTSSHSSCSGRALELLAPAGNWDCAKAAIENGTDAIYFGLQVGFNARARADNFSLDDLPDLMSLLHQRSVKGYVTLNTLVFTDELPQLEANVRRLAEAGVDAVLVQDIGAVRLIREICSGLSIHASTQMTMVSAETIAAIEQLDIERVVLARELSIDEIRKISSMTSMPLECFVHGALCVAYSGQCLTSESLGGRSANRGQCAQACRLDYKLHAQSRSTEVELPSYRKSSQYFLSPQDLAGHDHIHDLIEAGVTSFKIEGRLKTPEYVANTVRQYRQAIDAAMLQKPRKLSLDLRRELEMSFSRGFTPGWLEGCDHKRLVPGNSSAKRGVLVGKVVAQRGERITVDLTHPIGKGDGIVFEGNRAKGQEVGGRVYEVIVQGISLDAPQAGRVEWMFERGLMKKAELYAGQQIWQTDDPRLTKKLKATFSGHEPHFRRPIDLTISAHVGKLLSVTAQFGEHQLKIQNQTPLVEATKHPLTEELLREQLGRLGGTPFVLREISADIQGHPMMAFSQLGVIRKSLVDQLMKQLAKKPESRMATTGVAERMLSAFSALKMESVVSPAPALKVLCRSLLQLESVLSEGCRELYVEFNDIRDYRQAVSLARSAQAKIYLATLRIQKPGELGLFHALAKQQADGWLVRNLAAMRYAKENCIPMIGDFSLNVTNPLTAEWLMNQGMDRVTASYDLNRDQLLELIQHTPSSWLEIVIHQHVPMFHMEHCVFCTELSPGTNKSNCGRPCDRLAVQLEDRIGVKHVLHADVGCRNTLYNGTAQSGAEAVPALLQGNIRHFRIELLNDTSLSDVRRLLSLYRDLIAGKVSGSDVWKALKADNRVGVTRGTMEQPRNPLAII
jgi:U32 family peptidase